MEELVQINADSLIRGGLIPTSIVYARSVDTIFFQGPQLPDRDVLTLKNIVQSDDLVAT